MPQSQSHYKLYRLRVSWNSGTLEPWNRSLWRHLPEIRETDARAPVAEALRSAEFRMLAEVIEIARVGANADHIVGQHEDTATAAQTEVVGLRKQLAVIDLVNAAANRCERTDFPERPHVAHVE